jgi:catechol-2,3-dioxygenase
MAASEHGVGTFYAFVVDVNDLETCGRFWSQVLGADVLYQDQTYLRLGRAGERPTLLLQKIPERHGERTVPTSISTWPILRPQ